MSKSLFILMLSILGFIGCTAQNSSSIDSKEAYGLIKKADANIAILDVRTAKEFADGHVAGANPAQETLRVRHARVHRRSNLK